MDMNYTIYGLGYVYRLFTTM